MLLVQSVDDKVVASLALKTQALQRHAVPQGRRLGKKGLAEASAVRGVRHQGGLHALSGVNREQVLEADGWAWVGRMFLVVGTHLRDHEREMCLDGLVRSETMEVARTLG